MEITTQLRVVIKPLDPAVLAQPLARLNKHKTAQKLKSKHEKAVARKRPYYARLKADEEHFQKYRAFTNKSRQESYAMIQQNLPERFDAFKTYDNQRKRLWAERKRNKQVHSVSLILFYLLHCCILILNQL